MTPITPQETKMTHDEFEKRPDKITGSSPVYGNLREQAEELVGKPPMGEISLQKYDGTNVYQWHYRTAVYWEPWGQLMYIEQANS